MIAHDTITFQSLGRLQVLGVAFESCPTQQDASVARSSLNDTQQKRSEHAQPITFPIGNPANENNGKVTSLTVKKLLNSKQNSQN
jgi:hypothetical protein